MTPRPLWSLALLTVAALIVGRASAAPKPAPPKPNPDAKKAAEAAKEAAAAQAAFEEAEVLRQAYTLITTADHDYDGHRAKAEAAVHTALKELDHVVEKRGSAGEKAETAKEDAAAAAAKKAADKAPAVHENQAASDTQLAQAHKLLVLVRAALAERKQEQPLKHIDKAIVELETALKIK